MLNKNNGFGLGLVLLGALFVYAFAPFKAYWLAFLLPGILIFLTRSRTPRQTFFICWLVMLGFFIGGVYWVYFSMKVYGDLSDLEVLLLIFGLSGYLALYPAFALALTRWWAPMDSKHAALLVLPALWVLFEWLRGWLLTGFPWMTLGYTQTSSAIGQLGTWIGVYGVSAVVMVLGGLLYILFANKPREFLLFASAVIITAVIGWMPAVYILGSLTVIWLVWRKHYLVLVIPMVFGVAWLSSFIEWTQPVDANKLHVSILQMNVHQLEKWKNPDTSIKLHATKTEDILDRKELTKTPLDLIIWPETAAPRYYHEMEQGLILPLQKKLNAVKVEALIGIPVGIADPGKTSEDPRAYNTVLKVGLNLQQFHKTHLVPFGEYRPMQDWLDSFYKALNVPMNNFVPGPSDQTLLTIKEQPVGVFNCYEIAFPADVLRQLPRATLLVNLSNNAWFFDPRVRAEGQPEGRFSFWWRDSTQAWQQLEMAQMRAIETRRYALVSTNDGATAIIDPRGRVIKELPRYAQGELRGEVEMRQGRTPFILFGNYLVVLLAQFVLVYLKIRSRLV